MAATIPSVTNIGVRPNSLLMAPTATSQVFNCLANILGSSTLVHTRTPRLFCRRFKRYTLLSNTLTEAPRASAVRVANSPTTPAPIMITFVGGIPLIPPNKTPLPLLALPRYWPAISIIAPPAISLMLRTIGNVPLSSFRFSKLRPVILFSIIFSSNSLRIAEIWIGEIMV